MKQFFSRGAVALSVALFVAGLVSGATTPVGAHAADGHLARIQHGTCDQLGGVAFRLNGVGATVTAEGTPIAEPEHSGSEAAVNIDASVTDLEPSFTELTKDAYAIVVYESDEAMDQIIACGNVGGLFLAPEMPGMVMPGDELAIGLAPQGDAGDTGIALLRSVEGGSSRISIVLVEGTESGEEAAIPQASPVGG